MAEFLEPDLQRTRRARLRWAAAAVGGCGILTVGVLLATGLFTAGPDPVQSAPPPDRAAAGAAAPSDDPLVTAHRWLYSTRTVAHTDTHALAWTHRVAPLLTGPAAADNDRLAVHGEDTGGGWTRLVTGRCHVTVTSIDAVIPPEAPRTSDRVAVQVTGTVHTRCTAPAGAAAPVEHTAATLTLTRTTRDGLWRVHERLY